MTIFRSDLIDISKLKFQFVSANDPDTIGVEVMLDGNVLIDVAMNADGLTSVIFDQDGGSMEFDLDSLRKVLDKCDRELTEWRNGLTGRDGPWGEAE